MPEECLVIGRVIPERKCFRHESLPLDIKDPDVGIDARIIFRVVDGQLTANIIGEIGHLSYFTLKSIVRQAEQSWLDAHAFIHGEVFEVDIISILKHDEDRADGSFELHYEDSHDIIQAQVSELDVQTIWGLCESMYLRRALNDFRMALASYDDTPFYCYRAVETIRIGIGRENNLTKAKDQWDRMWDVLGGSRAEIEDFEKLATAIRHGEPVVYSGAVWRQAVSTAWNIVERYMLHLLRGRR